MGFVRFLIIVAAIGFAVHWWNGREPAGAAAAQSSPSGFVSAAMPDGVPPNTVVILAPLNCSSDEAQRADRLADALEGQRIPVLRTSHYSASGEGSDSGRQASLHRAVAVMNGEVPAVFVNGMAKANPSVDEVVSEYQRTK